MLVDSGEAAALLEKDERTVRRLCRDGKLEAIKVGRDWLISGKSCGARIAPRATSGRDIRRRTMNESA